jgi:type III secretion protein V
MPATQERATAQQPVRETRSEAIEPRLLRMLARRGDLVLVALMVVVVILLTVPLPTALLDVLITTNLAASIALLMLSLYIPSALGLSTFPSLLLLTTLFRLSLNIASTKLILLHGAAGHIIAAFGRMVVGGNVVVGLVVFLIVAIVQFIVIAKGAERVAEVGARFSLDGMPGKQMSIDADLRAGLIDKEEAQRRRAELEEEMRLHSALDGAMKFVKGDAIAGMLIALVNIVAGMAIGVSLRGMSLAESVDTYSVLSVGDGMVAQIPSLFVSIAAGIIITRVDGAQRGRNNLGVQIANQVLGHPNAMLMSAIIVASFLVVPGLPAWPFLWLALLLAGAGYLGRKTAIAASTAQHSTTPAMARDSRASVSTLADRNTVPIAVPLQLRVAPALHASLSAAAFDAALEAEKADLAQELGLPFPGLKWRVDVTLESNQYAIDVQELQVLRGDLDNTNVVKLAAPDATPQDPSKTLGRERTLVAHVGWAVRQHADAFVGMQETYELLARAAVELPDLTAEVQKAVPLQRIADVLRRLAQEGVSIRHLREICESLIVWGAREKDIVMLTEYVRVDLGRFIVRRYLDAKDQIRAVILDTEAEQALREAVQQGPGGSFLALPPETARALMTGAENALSPLRPDGPQVLLAPMDVRRYLKKFLATRFSTWTVLSFQELPPHVQIQTVGRLTLQHGSQRRAGSTKL